MIVITMAGESKRFFNAGFKKPKYQLELNGRSVFHHALSSFRNYFDTEDFLFVTRDIFQTNEFVEKEADDLGIKNYQVVTLEHPTKGQAETAYLGLKPIRGDFPIFIFNIDTFRPNYKKPKFIDDCDGYLEVFKAPGEHWSFVEPANEIRVARTTEKQRISELCSDGLYFFKKRSDFDNAFTKSRDINDLVKGEFYVAPLYNALIAEGKVINYHEVHPSEVVLCGTPQEFDVLNRENLGEFKAL